MKPNFALNLSHDGISLLHRNDGSKQGWSLVGEVVLGDPDMTAKLDMLRKTATGLEQSGMATKLVIPASQILFTDVTATAADDITREVQIREALDGLTPYEVGDLVFDWRRAKGKTVRVAVVARETLREAEGFAREHRFNPVSFVARGEKGFKGEAFFGMATGASALLGAGEKVEPDSQAIPRIAALRPAPPEAEETPENDAAKDTAAPTPPTENAAIASPDTPVSAPEPVDSASPPENPPVAPEKAPSEPSAPLAPSLSPESDAAERDDDARIAALLAEVPEPDAVATGDADLAPDQTDSPPAPENETKPAPTKPRAKAAPAPVLAPFPPSLDPEDSPKPGARTGPKQSPKPTQKPASRQTRKAPRPTGAKPAAPTAPKTTTKAPAPANPGGDSTPPPPPPRRKIPPLPGMVPAAPAKGAEPVSEQIPDRAGKAAVERTEKPAPGTPSAAVRAKAQAAARAGGSDSETTPPSLQADASGARTSPEKPTPAFASRRRETASGDIAIADLNAPGAAAPKAPPIPPIPPRAPLANGTTPPLNTGARNGSAAQVPASVTKPELAGNDFEPVPKPASESPTTKLSRAASAASKAAKGLINRRKASDKSGKQADSQAPAGIPSAPTSAHGKSAGKSGLFGLKAGLRLRRSGNKSVDSTDSARAGAKNGTPQALGKPRGQAEPKMADAAATAIAPTPITPVAKPLLPKEKLASAATSEAERLTMFGARRVQQEEIGGKPKYLGLVLTLVLLLIMAVIALGSVFIYGEPEVSGAAPNGGGDFAAASVPEALLPSPAVDQGAILAPSETAPPPTSTSGSLTSPPVPAESPAGPEINTTPIAPLEETAAETPVEPVETAEAPAPPRSPEVLSQDAAQTRYAATGIWEKAPVNPSEPQTSRIDDLYIASIDPKVAGHDPVALPPTTSSAPESRPATPLPPAAPGTDFALNDEGLVAPTTDGTLSPDGILIYLGKPPVDPPIRPGTVRPEILPDDTLRGFRPKPRPTGLIEETQRANNSGNTLLELAGFRPNPRPTELAAEAIARASADAGAVEDAVAGVIAEGDLINTTDEAVAASPQPGHRPGNFAAIVATARTNADASDGSTVVAASAAPTTSPAIPTRANVATQATIKNAIRLNQLNLIGIYGSSASRRALVRLKSGRYVKVSVGERLNGGKVVSITDSRLIYTKNGRNHTLELLPLG